MIITIRQQSNHLRNVHCHCEVNQPNSFSSKTFHWRDLLSCQLNEVFLSFTYACRNDAKWRRLLFHRWIGRSATISVTLKRKTNIASDKIKTNRNWWQYILLKVFHLFFLPLSFSFRIDFPIIYAFHFETRTQRHISREKRDRRTKVNEKKNGKWKQTETTSTRELKCRKRMIDGWPENARQTC